MTARRRPSPRFGVPDQIEQTLPSGEKRYVLKIKGGGTVEKCEPFTYDDIRRLRDSFDLESVKG